MTLVAPVRAPEHAIALPGAKQQLRVAALFAGIGGIELGLHAAGAETVLMSEIDPAAQHVLKARFPNVRLMGDVRELDELPVCDLVSAGFPCQDLSQAGRTAGIGGSRSGLVDEVFRLLERDPPPTWLLLENVPFMLHLERGRAMTYLVDRLERLGYLWAYRTVDTRSFGLPQRRRRVLLLASKTEDPRTILLAQDAGERVWNDDGSVARGFYWTEGTKGLGWAVDAIPTLKGGSSVGIPSAPAIWMPDGRIVTPDVRDAERLQGFEPGWTDQPSSDKPRANGPRWKLVGNAVSVPVGRWLGERMRGAGDEAVAEKLELRPGQPWPPAAWGRSGRRFAAPASAFPVHEPYQHLAQFLKFEPVPLSERAAKGFHARATASSLRFPEGLLAAVKRYTGKDDRAGSA